jgi:hypothetical protein
MYSFSDFGHQSLVVVLELRNVLQRLMSFMKVFSEEWPVSREGKLVINLDLFQSQSNTWCFFNFFRRFSIEC